MGALTGEYRCPVADIRDAAPDDFDAVFALLDARSVRAFGVSQEDRKFLRQRWDLPGGGRWVAVDGDEIVGYAVLDENQDFSLAAVDPDVVDALIAHVEHNARSRGFEHLAVTTVPEDVPLYEGAQRNGYTLDREILRMWRRLERRPAGAAVAGRHQRAHLRRCRLGAGARAARRRVRRLGRDVRRTKPRRVARRS